MVCAQMLETFQISEKVREGFIFKLLFKQVWDFSVRKEKAIVNVCWEELNNNLRNSLQLIKGAWPSIYTWRAPLFWGVRAALQIGIFPAPGSSKFCDQFQGVGFLFPPSVSRFSCPATKVPSLQLHSVISRTSKFLFVYFERKQLRMKVKENRKTVPLADCQENCQMSGVL